MTNDAPLILCCEDEPQLLRDICEEVQGAGYRVIAARNGAELLAHLEHSTPDLILCDIMMPGIDGYGVLARLRRDHPHLAHVPLVFLSALSMTEAVVQGKRLGADDYLTKPINYDLLISTIEARLRQSCEARAALRQSAVLGRHLFESLSVGLLVFTPNGQMTQANASARAVMGSAADRIADRLAEPVRRIGARAEAGHEDSLSLMLDDSTNQMAQIHGCPPDPATDDPCVVIVFLSDSSTRGLLSMAALRELFGLTPTEARVVRNLARGLRPEEISERLGVAQTTIAFHLRNVFAKTKTHRQAQLVALAHTLPLRDPARTLPGA